MDGTTYWISLHGSGLHTASVPRPPPVAVESIVDVVSAPSQTTLHSPSSATTAPSVRAKGSERPHPFWASALRSSRPTHQSRTTAESFHGYLKQEYIWSHDHTNGMEAEAGIAAACGDTTVPGYTGTQVRPSGRVHGITDAVYKRTCVKSCKTVLLSGSGSHSHRLSFQ